MDRVEEIIKESLNRKQEEIMSEARPKESPIRIDLESLDEYGNFSSTRFLTINGLWPLKETVIHVDDKLTTDRVLPFMPDFTLLDARATMDFRGKIGLKKSIYVNHDRTCVIHLGLNDIKGEYDWPYIKIIHSSKYEGRSIQHLSHFKKSDVKKKKINFLIVDQHGYHLKEKEIDKNFNLDYDLSYNNGYSYERIESAITQRGSGLIIFAGEPGTGKTSLIKYLIQNIDKKFIFLPTSMTTRLDDPAFIGFCIDELDDSVLILEDGEQALASRAGFAQTPVGSILNITDGLYGDMLNMKLISTQNVTENIDPALMRRGRLLERVNFQRLEAVKATELSKHLGFNQVYDTPQILADIYNVEDNGVEEKRKVGFK